MRCEAETLQVLYLLHRSICSTDTQYWVMLNTWPLGQIYAATSLFPDCPSSLSHWDDKRKTVEFVRCKPPFSTFANHRVREDHEQGNL